MRNVAAILPSLRNCLPSQATPRKLRTRPLLCHLKKEASVLSQPGGPYSLPPLPLSVCAPLFTSPPSGVARLIRSFGLESNLILPFDKLLPPSFHPMLRSGHFDVRSGDFCVCLFVSEMSQLMPGKIAQSTHE